MSTFTVKIRINWNTKVESYSQPYQGKGGAPVKDAEDGDDNMTVDQNNGNVIKNDEENVNENLVHGIKASGAEHTTLRLRMKNIIDIESIKNIDITIK